MATSTKQTQLASSKLLEHAKNSTGWNNHLPLVYLALEETKAGTVIEMGVGGGSTVQLSEYCKKNKRQLKSFETDKEWMGRYIENEGNYHSITLIDIRDYPSVFENNKDATVVLIDHSPGEDRKFRAEQFKDIKGVVICHDAQPKPNAGDYQFETIFPLFKYLIRIQPPFDSVHNDYPTGAIALSNTIDVTKWEGLVFGEWKVSNTF